MNDRFKFRAKRLDNKRFVYGYLCFIYIDNENHCRIYYPDEATSYDCYTKTLGQCTGRKDKNGQLIYDGDIVVLDDTDSFENPIKTIIRWAEESARFGLFFSHKLYYGLDYFERENLEVIGNIHDNPELLEDK